MASDMPIAAVMRLLDDHIGADGKRELQMLGLHVNGAEGTYGRWEFDLQTTMGCGGTSAAVYLKHGTATPSGHAGRTFAIDVRQFIVPLAAAIEALSGCFPQPWMIAAPGKDGGA